ncbi:hypothetical protein, variant [Allomyces macrogynus ATCC 38327]|nr:hypothetical protein, variant [Allomyces macrogynus ATCC 38327]|eukprot:KNE55244.1 hypothetical protein, variant [Allomyces macrogynus ATCC 38327]
MLEAGADVDAVDSHNGTALMYAARDNHVETVKTLLDYGASVTHRDDNGWTALDYGMRYDEVRTLLQETLKLDEEAASAPNMSDPQNRHEPPLDYDNPPPSSSLTPLRTLAQSMSLDPGGAVAAAPPVHAQPPPPPVSASANGHSAAAVTAAATAAALSAEDRVQHMYHEYCKVVEYANRIRGFEAFWMDRWYELVCRTIQFLDSGAQVAAHRRSSVTGDADAAQLELAIVEENLLEIDRDAREAQITVQTLKDHYDRHLETTRPRGLRAGRAPAETRTRAAPAGTGHCGRCKREVAANVDGEPDVGALLRGFDASGGTTALPAMSPSASAGRSRVNTSASTMTAATTATLLPILDEVQARCMAVEAEVRRLREQNMHLLREVDQKDGTIRLFEHQVTWLKLNHETITTQQSQTLNLQAQALQNLVSTTTAVAAHSSSMDRLPTSVTSTSGGAGGTTPASTSVTGTLPTPPTPAGMPTSTGFETSSAPSSTQGTIPPVDNDPQHFHHAHQRRATAASAASSVTARTGTSVFPSLVRHRARPNLNGHAPAPPVRGQYSAAVASTPRSTLDDTDDDLPGASSGGGARARPSDDDEDYDNEVVVSHGGRVRRRRVRVGTGPSSRLPPHPRACITARAPRSNRHCGTISRPRRRVRRRRSSPVAPRQPRGLSSTRRTCTVVRRRRGPGLRRPRSRRSSARLAGMGAG